MFCLEVTYIGVNNEGWFNPRDVLNAIKSNTILISIMLANNETGVIQPITELGLELGKFGYNKNQSFNDADRICPLFLHTDAAQAIGKINVNVEDLNVDYLTIVGHKVTKLFIQIG